MAGSSEDIPIPFTTVYSNSNENPLFHPATRWIRAAGIAKVRGIVELRTPAGPITLGFGYQTGDVENSPGDPTIIGDYASSVGVAYGSFTDLVTALAGEQLVRFGFFTKNSSTTNLTFCRAAGVVQIVR